MKFPVFQILYLLAPVVEEVIAAARADSPGGKKITKAEWRAIRRALSARLLDGDVAELLD